LVGKDPDDSERQVLCVAKCNLGRKAKAIAYRLKHDALRDVAQVAWEAETEHTPEQLLAAPATEEEAGAAERAKEYLLAALADGPRASGDLIREADSQHGVSRRTLFRAKSGLKIVAARDPGKPGTMGHKWYWSLPAGDPPTDDPPAADEPAARVPTTPKSANPKGWHSTGHLALNGNPAHAEGANADDAEVL
jgi:hypothetical protein